LTSKRNASCGTYLLAEFDPFTEFADKGAIAKAYLNQSKDYFNIAIQSISNVVYLTRELTQSSFISQRGIRCFLTRIIKCVKFSAIEFPAGKECSSLL